MCIDLICRCLELVMVKAAGEDGVDNHHDFRYDISKVGRLTTPGLLMNDAVHFMDGLCVSCNLAVTQ